MAEIAIGVICPIIVLKANEVIAPHETPLVRSAVPKSSAGTAHDRGPLVIKKTKLKTQVITMNAQWAPVLVEVAGNCWIKTAFTMKVILIMTAPYISNGLRPIESMTKIQTEVPKKAMIALTACNISVVSVGIPICAKIWGEKYWIALTPVIWQLA